MLVLWHKKSTAYHCPKCGNKFEMSFLTDFFSPHGVTKKGGGWTYLKCPRCQNRTKMEILVKTKETEGIKVKPKNSKQTCYLCGKKIPEQDRSAYNGMCWKCWDDQLTEESDNIFDELM